ncbi:MAG: glycosyltransferase family 2 protein [Patescibacteria group bacterium]
MDKKDLSIIIVHHKSKNITLDCIKSIREQIFGISHEVIVVDNSENTEYRIQNTDISKILGPSTFCLLPSANKGFGAGNNLGASKANGEYLLLLNPDTIVFDNSIEKMLSFIKKHDEIGALTCLLGPDKKTLQKNFFGRFQSLLSVTFRHYNYQKVDLSREFFYTDIVTGAALMIKKEIFEKVGRFDERFFMYLEDDDLCKRLVDAGYKNAVLNTAKIIHLEGKSISKNAERKKIYYQSQNLYWQKHNGLLPTIIMRVIRWPYKFIRTK